jgi:hypothetical protein
MHKKKPPALCSSCCAVHAAVYRLASAHPLPHDDLLKFISKVIDDPWDFGYDSITCCLQVVGLLRLAA